MEIVGRLFKMSNLSTPDWLITKSLEMITEIN